VLERIDKIIASQGKYSRSEVKTLISKKKVFLDGEIVRSSSIKADPNMSVIIVNGEELSFKKFVYLMLNKPKGYVSATEDRDHKTVLELVPEEFAGRDLFPAGRLDRDTTGLMIITDDGQMAHNILSPKKHVQKIYHVELDIPVTEEMSIGFTNGVELNDGVCKDASLEITGENSCFVTLKEGRYHQIKRMFVSFGLHVVELHRIRMGKLDLDESLAPGECRPLTAEELVLLKTREEIAFEE